MEIKRNPDKTKYKQISEAVKQNDGYCPCMVFKNEDSKCPCKEFREQNHAGECRCGRYIKVAESEIYYPETVDEWR